MGARTLYWGGCAWDSFAIPHLAQDEPRVLVATTCPPCGAAHAWVVDRDAPPAGDQVAHFLVPVPRIWDDVVQSCANQRSFCGEPCVDRWLADTGNERGSVLGPVRFVAARAGRRSPGYCPRQWPDVRCWPPWRRSARCRRPRARPTPRSPGHR